MRHSNYSYARQSAWAALARFDLQRSRQREDLTASSGFGFDLDGFSPRSNNTPTFDRSAKSGFRRQTACAATAVGGGERITPDAPPRRVTSRRGPRRMKSIGEISIAPPARRDFGHSRRARAGRAQPQEAQHSGPQGDPGPTAPACSAPLFLGRAGEFEGWGSGAPLVLFAPLDAARDGHTAWPARSEISLCLAGRGGGTTWPSRCVHRSSVGGIHGFRRTAVEDDFDMGDFRRNDAEALGHHDYRPQDRANDDEELSYFLNARHHIHQFLQSVRLCDQKVPGKRRRRAHDFREARPVRILTKITVMEKRPFSTRLRKILRRYGGARVSSACSARLRLATAAAAPSSRRCGWKTGFITGKSGVQNESVGWQKPNCSSANRRAIGSKDRTRPRGYSRPRWLEAKA